MSNFSAISWQEQVVLSWRDGGEVLFTFFDFQSTILLVDISLNSGILSRFRTNQYLILFIIAQTVVKKEY
jgi:hypothetical protein